MHLTEEHESFRAEVRANLAAHIIGPLADWDAAAELPRSVWRLLGSWGYLDLAYSGADLFRSVVLLEELGRTGYSGFRAAVGVHAYMATQYLAAYGSPELRQRYLPGAATGERIAALAITEPQAGSDLGALALAATAKGESLVLDGTKAVVTNGTTADFVVVAARTGPADTGPTGLSLVVVDTDTPGLTVTARPTAGWRAAGVAELEFDGVEVPAANVVGRTGSGFYYLMRGLSFERVVAAALAIGGMDHCLDLTRTHLRSRHAYGAPLAALQSPRHTIADLATRLSAARHLLYDTAWRFTRGDLPVNEAAMAKLYATELACEVADRCLRLHGVAGYTPDSPVVRAHLEARAATVAAGPSEVMLDLIASAELDHPAQVNRETPTRTP